LSKNCCSVWVRFSSHTTNEFVLKKDLEKAVGLYVNLEKKLLADEDKFENLCEFADFPR